MNGYLLLSVVMMTFVGLPLLALLVAFGIAVGYDLGVWLIVTRGARQNSPLAGVSKLSQSTEDVLQTDPDMPADWSEAFEAQWRVNNMRLEAMNGPLLTRREFLTYKPRGD